MQPSPELEAIVRRFLVARRDADFDRVRNIYSLSEHFRAIGTAEDDWIDSDRFQAIIQSDWSTFPITVDEVRKMEAFENGNTGWVAMEAERTTESGRSFVYRLTVVFVMEAGQWRAIQTHFSVPVEDEVLHGPALTGTLSDLLESMGPDAATGSGTGRTATVVFTDIVGSTSLSQSMGDDAWSSTVEGHFDALRSIVEDEGGVVVKTLGDGGMYVFETARSALAAAERIRALDDELPVRIGVHTGDLIVSGDDYLGAAVAKAARLTAAADGGGVLVSATTVGMANPTEFSFGPPTSLELAGLAGVHVVHELG